MTKMRYAGAVLRRTVTTFAPGPAMTMLVLICGNSEPSWIVPLTPAAKAIVSLPLCALASVDCFAQGAVAPAAGAVIVIVDRGNEESA